MCPPAQQLRVKSAAGDWNTVGGNQQVGFRPARRVYRYEPYLNEPANGYSLILVIKGA